MAIHRTTHQVKQQGMVVSGFALIMIVVLALTAVATSGTALLSQRIASNDNRIGQALDAAEAGMDLAMAALRNATPPYPTLSRTLPNGTSFVTTISDASLHNQARYVVVSRGTSIDQSATRTVRQTFALLHLLQNAPETPLITRYSVTFKGNASIVNPEGFTTIWSGHTTGFAGNSNGGTYIDVNGDGTLLKSTSSNTYGGDVVLNDITLANLNDDTFYYTFMGVPRNKLQELANISPNVYWLSDPSGTIKIASNPVFGSPENPVIVYIDGNTDITGTPVFYGLVYVRGDFGKAGTAVVNGAVVVEGNTEFSELTGNLQVVYNSDLLSRINTAPPYVNGLAGTWKDF